jgi:hypothetical protein
MFVRFLRNVQFQIKTYWLSNNDGSFIFHNRINHLLFSTKSERTMMDLSEDSGDHDSPKILKH